MTRVFFLSIALLAGCAQFPELDATLPPNAEDMEYPELIPLDDALLGGNQTEEQADTAAGLEARVARLRARAARLNGSVVDSGTRSRMDAGVDASATNG